MALKQKKEKKTQKRKEKSVLLRTTLDKRWESKPLSSQVKHNINNNLQPICQVNAKEVK